MKKQVRRIGRLIIFSAKPAEMFTTKSTPNLNSRTEKSFATPTRSTSGNGRNKRLECPAFCSAGHRLCKRKFARRQLIPCANTARNNKKREFKRNTKSEIRNSKFA